MDKSSRGLRNPKQYIPQLESLRGWAILLVVAFHYFGILWGDSSSKGLPESSAVWLRIIGAGNTGVTLFFVLSGFLLTQPFIQALKSDSSISIRRFYAARLLRIIPLYYTAVLVAWLVSSNTDSAVKALLFIPVGFEIFPFSVPWWSLSTEMQFYLVLPWVILAFTKGAGRVVLLIAVLVVLGLYLGSALAPSWLGSLNNAWPRGTLIDRGFAFVMGGMAAWLHGSTSAEVNQRHPALELQTQLLGYRSWYRCCGYCSGMD